MEKKWYKTKWGIAAIVLLFPLFLLGYGSKLIWQQRWDKTKRIVAIAALWGIVLGSGMFLSWQEQNEIVDCTGQDGKVVRVSKRSCDELHIALRKITPEKPTEPTTAQTISTPTPQPTVGPTNTPKIVEKYDVVVSSQIVKHVDGKYRYFFDIRNHDTKPFEGSVSITLFNQDLKNPLAGDSFNTKAPIDPELGASVYTDAFTGPTSVHGGNGIIKFKYVVKVGNDTVNSGEGEITDTFEDVDAYGF